MLKNIVEILKKEKIRIINVYWLIFIILLSMIGIACLITGVWLINLNDTQIILTVGIGLTCLPLPLFLFAEFISIKLKFKKLKHQIEEKIIENAINAISKHSKKNHSAKKEDILE